METVIVGNFNNSKMDLHLTRRDAPTPSEKSITENIPFSQGVLDYSMILGERVFNNRPLEYEFIALYKKYPNRKVLEQKIKQAVMMNGVTKIFDSHDEGFYWLGKSVSVEVMDDHIFSRLVAVLTFNVHPYMFAVDDFLEDNWDNLQFAHHAINFNQYSVDGELEIELYNWGDRKVFPIIEVEVID